MKRKHQPRVKGGRDPSRPCVVHEVKRRVQLEANKHGVSRSWVVAWILSVHFGVYVKEYY